MVKTADTDEIKMTQEPHIKQIWWQTSLVLVFSALCIYIGMGFEDGFDRLFPEQRPIYSVLNNRQSGWSGLFEIAREAHFDCQAWEAPYRELKNLKGLLVIVQPSQPIDEAEFRQILDWVKAGNQLIYIDLFTFETARDLVKKLNIGVEEQTIRPGVFVPEHEAKECNHVKNFLLSAKTILRGGKAVVKVGGGDGKGALLTEVQFGRGRVLLGTMPSLCSNSRLDDDKTWDGFQFLLNWFDTSQSFVMFDERCHGYSGSQNVFAYLLKSYSGPPSAQAAVILLLAILSAHQRFGEVIKVTRKRPISNLEFVEGMANTYRRSGAALLASTIIVTDFRNRVAKWANVSPHLSEQELSDALTGGDQKDAKLGGKISDFFARHNMLIAKKRISEHELSDEIEALDQLRDESATNFGETRS